MSDDDRDPWWFVVIAVAAVLFLMFVLVFGVDGVVHGGYRERVCGAAAIYWSIDRADPLLKGIARWRRKR